MKVILTGATGYIGQAVLQAILQNPAIISLVVLSRRNLPDLEPLNARYSQLRANADLSVEVVVLESFNEYPEHVLETLKDADAAIWCIGTYHGSEAVDVEYPAAYQRVQLKALSQRQSRFRYVHLGGAFTEADQSRDLWFLSNARKVRGRAETEAGRFATYADGPGTWDSHVVKPAAILPFSATSGWGVLGLNAGVVVSAIIGQNWSVCLDEVAAMMVDLALNGSGTDVDADADGSSRAYVWLNKDVVKRGGKVLRNLQERT